jgi:hypothetical protein
MCTQIQFYDVQFPYNFIISYPNNPKKPLLSEFTLRCERLWLFLVHLPAPFFNGLPFARVIFPLSLFVCCRLQLLPPPPMPHGRPTAPLWSPRFNSTLPGLSFPRASCSDILIRFPVAIGPFSSGLELLPITTTSDLAPQATAINEKKEVHHIELWECKKQDKTQRRKGEPLFPTFGSLCRKWSHST